MNLPNNPAQKEKNTIRALKLQTVNLSQFMVKLSHFYQGVIPSLDQELKNLRSHLNNSTVNFSSAEVSIAKLSGLMMDNADTIKRLDRHSSKVLSDSIENLRQIPHLPESINAEVLKFSNSIKTANSSFIDSLEVFEQIIAFYQKSLAVVLLQASSKTHQTQPQEHARNNIYQDLINELSALLGTLIQNDTKDQELLQIRTQLLHDVDPETLLNCCRKVISAISKNVFLERHQNEKFVLHLQSSLSDVNETVTDSIEKVEQSLSEKEQKNDTLQGHIESIEHAVDSSSDLQQLKTQASDYLAKMSASLNDNKQSDQDEQRMLMTLLNDMQSRLTTLEGETANYKKRLIELKKRTNHDSLTKIPNRIAYNQRVEMEYRRWQRSKRPLALAIIDVDHFKNINDTYAHSAGDKTLQVIAQTISKTLRSTDFLARWGGEEFVVLFPDTDEGGIKTVLEKVRCKIESIPFRFKDKKVTITVSIGATDFKLKDNIEQVFDRADKNLYKAKNSGRNRCILE
ncbi:MAG: diguanylate cyclase [Paraglaciecola sp.]|jgi:diguanylate cyclase